MNLSNIGTHDNALASEIGNTPFSLYIEADGFIKSLEKKEVRILTQGKLKENTEGLLDLTKNIRVVILENLIHQRKLKCLR
jgi:hypothetical protein